MHHERVVEVSGLVKRYDSVVAVDGISFDVYGAEVFSLLGPNGAGKTTTVEILACLRKPTAGLVRVLGFDVYRDEVQIKRRIGVMPQDFSAFGRLTVKENVELIAKIYGFKADVGEYLEKLGLWSVRNKKFHTLSGGMKRRVGVCMALASDPQILFLDEPTTGLDPQGRREVWDAIRALKTLGKTVFLTTHYMDEAEKLSDRVAIMVRGRIVAIDSVENVLQRYGGGVKIVVRGGKGEVERLLKKFTERVFIDEEGNIVGKFRDRREAIEVASQIYGLRENIAIEIAGPTMEDVFLRLAGAKVDERGELV